MIHARHSNGCSTVSGGRVCSCPCNCSSLGDKHLFSTHIQYSLFSSNRLAMHPASFYLLLPYCSRGSPLPQRSARHVCHSLCFHLFASIDIWFERFVSIELPKCAAMYHVVPWGVRRYFLVICCNFPPFFPSACQQTHVGLSPFCLLLIECLNLGQWNQFLPEGKVLVVLYLIGLCLSVRDATMSMRSDRFLFRRLYLRGASASFTSLIPVSQLFPLVKNPCVSPPPSNYGNLTVIYLRSLYYDPGRVCYWPPTRHFVPTIR